MQEQNNNSKKNNIIISIAITVISIILGIFVSKYLYTISIVGVLVLIIGLINHNKKKKRYERKIKQENTNNSVVKDSDVEKNKEEISKENEILDRKITELINQKSYDENEINRIKNTENSTEEIENELEKLEQKLQEMNHKYNILEKTERYLIQAKERFSSHYLNNMTQGFEKYLNTINNEKMDTNIDVKLNVKIQEYGEKKEIEYLSTGYKDIIGICMRLALIEALFEKEKPFIILDDPFVNLDEEKIEKAKQIVQELSKTHQVIYFICHKCRE